MPVGHRTLDFATQTPHIAPMPLYEYELCEGSCAACGGRFTLRRPVTATELKACPACKSGFDINIRERFEHVLQVDLKDVQG